ncbi:MAG: hypothetical protein ABIH23_31620 [bacterium]
MYVKAIVSMLIFAGGTYASSSVLEDFLEGTMNMVSIHAARAEMKMIHGKFTEFRIANNRYPAEPQIYPFLQQEFDTPLENVCTDPWMSAYLLLGPEVEIRCTGPDKKEKSRDDLVIEYPRGAEPPAWSRSKRRR